MAVAWARCSVELALPCPGSVNRADEAAVLAESQASVARAVLKWEQVVLEDLKEVMPVACLTLAVPREETMDPSVKEEMATPIKVTTTNSFECFTDETL